MDSYWRPPFHANTDGTLTSAEPVRGADGQLVCTMLSIERLDGVVTKVPFLAQDGLEGLAELVGRDVSVRSIPIGQSSGGVKVMQAVVWEPSVVYYTPKEFKPPVVQIRAQGVMDQGPYH